MIILRLLEVFNNKNVKKQRFFYVRILHQDYKTIGEVRKQWNVKNLTLFLGKIRGYSDEFSDLHT